MAESIEKTIYRLEIDDSEYTSGVNRMEGSTKRLVDIQNAANKALKILEEALKSQSDFLREAKRDLDSYSGADANYRKQLTETFKTAQQENSKLNTLVVQARKEYDLATKAAQEFANISAKATNLQDRTTGGKIPTGPQLGVAAGLSAQIFNAVNLTDFAELAEITARTTQEFDELRDSITLAEERMKQLNGQGDEFMALSAIVDSGKKALADYDNVTKQAAGSTVSLRTQIRQGRDELVRLEEAGKGTSQEYIELEKNVARLTDAFQDQQQRIKILASDTRALDFGKAAITSAISAFQIYTSVAILAGNENDELQKKTLQLFAAMQLLTALEQLSNQVRRGGVIITNLQSAAQATYTAVVGASTGALRAFRIALLATGVGAAIAGIVALVLHFRRAAAAAEELHREEKILNEIQKEVAQSAGAEIAVLQRLYTVATNVTIPIKERKKAVDELQKQYPDYFKNINQEIILQGGAAAAYDATKLAILEAAKARAIESKLTTLATDELEKDQQKQDILRKQEKNRLAQQKADRKDARDSETRGLDQFAAIAAGTELKKELGDVNKDLDNIAKDREFLLSKITTAGTKTPPPPPTKGTKTGIENIFIQEKARLEARLAELRRTEIDSIEKINNEFAAKLIVEQNRIEKLIAEKKITGKITDEKSQAGILFKLSVQANQVELDKALADFNKKVTDAKEKLNDEILDLQNKNTQDQLNLIQDEFDRRKQLIDFNEQRELADAKEATEDRLAALEFDKLLIGEQAYQEAKEDIISAGEQAALNIIREAAQDRQDLGADTFSASLDALNALFEDQLLNLDEITAGKIQAEKALLLQGVINYDEFQKRITKILRDEKTERDRLRLLELDSELNAIRVRLDTVTDAEERDDLLDRQRALRRQKAEIQSKTDEVIDPNKERVETVQEYAEAIGQVADAVIGFWQKANDAEREALDRSITIQEQRVNAAQRIAERGNAAYLKAEEDRLKELQVIRENAARRDLAINAALQASQILVGITGAISKLAQLPPGAGAAAVIAEIAVIVAALATGYGLVKSLQGNQPTFFKGTKRVRRESYPQGVDTIPAWLNEGEAVIPTEKNKAYHPTVAAIYDGTVPPEHLNEFVKTYHQVKGVPQVNYQRIKDTAEMSIGQNGRLGFLLTEQNKKLDENNELQRQTLRAMKNMSVSANIDRNGVAIAVNEYMEQMKIDKKT